MNSAYFSWGIHGAHFQSENLKLFLREANTNLAVKLLDLATISCVGQAAESKAVLPRRGVGWPVVLPHKIMFGFPLKTSGCFWLSSKALHAN